MGHHHVVVVVVVAVAISAITIAAVAAIITSTVSAAVELVGVRGISDLLVILRHLIRLGVGRGRGLNVHDQHPDIIIRDVLLVFLPDDLLDVVGNVRSIDAKRAVDVTLILVRGAGIRQTGEHHRGVSGNLDCRAQDIRVEIH